MDMNADETIIHAYNLYSPALDRRLTVPLVGRSAASPAVRSISWHTLDDDGLCDLTDNATARDEHDLWIPTCPLVRRPEKGRGRASDVAGLVALWADLDIAGPGHHPPEGKQLPRTENEAMAIVRRLPEPSMIMRTGGGLHLWWLLDNLYETRTDEHRSNAATISETWHAAIVSEGARLGYHVDAVGDLARIMRLSGTRNHKRTPADDVTTIYGGSPYDLPTRYRLAYLDEVAAPLAPLPDPVRSPVSPIPRPARPATTGGGPTEWFAAATWSEVLEPSGFVMIGHDHDGRELWQRPGSESGSHSLAADPDGAAVVFSSVLAAEWRLGINEGVSKAFAFAALHFNGDMADMGRELREAAKRRLASAS